MPSVKFAKSSIVLGLEPARRLYYVTTQIGLTVSFLIQTMLQTEPTVRINWAFVGPFYPLPNVWRMDIPLSLFNAASDQCRGLFAREIQRTGLSSHVDPASITFWRPGDSLTITMKQKEWEEVSKKPDEVFVQIPLATSFSEQLEKTEDHTRIHLVVTENVVLINWVLDHPIYHVTRCLMLPRPFFYIPAALCREFVARVLLKDMRLQVNPSTLRFWRPRSNLSAIVPHQEGWQSIIANFENSFARIPFACSLSEELEKIEDRNLVHLIITTTEPPVEVDYPVCASPYRSPERILVTEEEFSSEGGAIHDLGDAKAMPPTPPRLQIYHPVFGAFLHFLQDSQYQPTNEELMLTEDFMAFSSQLLETEDDRFLNTVPLLNKILRREVTSTTSYDGVRTDGVYQINIHGTRTPIFIMELKREIGDGGSDPSIRARTSMRHHWGSSRQIPIRSKCCSPTLMLVGAGPWFGVLGGVITDVLVEDGMIVQRLTSLNRMRLSFDTGDDLVYYNARLFVALRESIAQLEQFYKEDIETKNSSQRYFPYPTTFLAHDNTEVKFEYLYPLKDSRSMTFKARIVDPLIPEEKLIVVKFVSRYGEEGHRLLADNGYAPKLLYYGPLPGSPPPLPIESPADNAPPGLCLERNFLRMVVMEHISAVPYTRLPVSVHPQLQTILAILHKEGYVFGDFRVHNILIDPQYKVKLIDFNWCGRYQINGKSLEKNYVRYPLSISREIDWPEGVRPLAPIRPEHDLEMLERLPFE